MPPLSQNRLLLQGEGSSRLGVLLALPPLSLVDMLHVLGGRFRFLVVPFPPCGLPLLGYLFAWTLVLAPFFFPHFLRCLLFIKFGFLFLMWFLSYLSELATQCVMAIYK
jgi:hypothetical protein